MLTRRSIPQWPDNVLYTPEGIIDQVRDQLILLNATGHQIAQQINNHQNVEAIAQILAQCYSLPLDTALQDTYAFLLRLNRSALVNINNPFSLPSLKSLILMWVNLHQFGLIRTLSYLIHLACWRRYTLRFHSISTGLCSMGQIAWGVLRGYWALWLLLWFLIYTGANMFHRITDMPLGLDRALFLTTLVTAGLILGLTVHEAGHALALGRFNHGEVIFVVHLLDAGVLSGPIPPSQELFVALIGPGLNFLVATVLFLIAVLLPASAGTYLRWLASTIAVWGLSLIPIFKDGRSIVHLLRTVVAKMN